MHKNKETVEMLAMERERESLHKLPVKVTLSISFSLLLLDYNIILCTKRDCYKGAEHRSPFPGLLLFY